MTQFISKEKAQSMVTDNGWKMVSWGMEAYSKCGGWVVYAAGYLYKRRLVKRGW